MDIEHIRSLLTEGTAVVIAEDGKTPLVVRELHVAQAAAVPEVPVEEVPISSRWPKGRSINEEPPREKQDQILERLNKEISALRDQIARDEDGAVESIDSQ